MPVQHGRIKSKQQPCYSRSPFALQPTAQSLLPSPLHHHPSSHCHGNSTHHHSLLTHHRVAPKSTSAFFLLHDPCVVSHPAMGQWRSRRNTLHTTCFLIMAVGVLGLGTISGPVYWSLPIPTALLPPTLAPPALRPQWPDLRACFPSSWLRGTSLGRCEDPTGRITCPM